MKTKQELLNENEKLKSRCEKLESELSWYKEQIKLSKTKQFGKYTETTDEQLNMFNEAEAERVAINPEPAIETITYNRKKKKGHREKMLSNLPVEVIEHKIEDATCPKCSNEMHVMTEEVRKELRTIKKLDFIENHQNLILAGNPGTGKTHLAVATGILACNQGYKVLFTTVSNMINRLKETKSQKTLMSFENQIEKYDLLILDELGYISFDKEGSELLFTHLSLRAERKSTIITTNLSFERWEEIFKDPVMTAAMIDRLTHKSYVVNMNGNSYRLKETQDMLKSL